MTPETLLADLSARDIIVTVAGNSIELDAPAGVLTDVDVAAMRKHKSDVIRLLRLAEGLPIDDDAAALLAMDEVDPAEVPACESCARLCDAQTLDDRWHCSRCDGYASERRQRTDKLIRLANQIRIRSNRHG